MPYDFKKEFKELYNPKDNPSFVTVPETNYLCVQGKGNPNDEHGEYKAGIEQLYTVAYTLRMSHKGDYKIEGFYEYIVPPLESFWWQNGTERVDVDDKDTFGWISLIRLPDFIKPADVYWAKNSAAQKKKGDFSKVEFFTYEEGDCVQCLHVGPYDAQVATTKKMAQHAQDSGYRIDITDKRYHHEIYLSDPRKVEADKLKTIIRLPITQQEE